MKRILIQEDMIKLFILWGILLLLLIYSQAHAIETVSQGKSEIISEGIASVLQSVDIDEAKEKALDQAKNEAILKVVALHVNAEILSKEKNNLIKFFKPKQKEIIDEYKIVSEDRGEDGFYRVKIQAKIKEDALKNILMKNLYDNRVIVVTSEKNLGNTIKRHILEHELISRVKDKGYRIVDYRTIKNRTVSDLVSSIRQGNTESVKKMGIYYLTDIVVVGFVETKFSERTKDIYSAHATGQVKIHQIGNKKEIVSLTRHNVKGFGSNIEKAGLDSINRISKEMSEEAIKSLTKKYVRKVKLIIREVGSSASVRKMKDMISRIPYINDVREGYRNMDIEETTLYIKTTKGVEYVANRLSDLKCFIVKKIQNAELSIEARKIVSDLSG
jgi:hypothetical protein